MAELMKQLLRDGYSPDQAKKIALGQEITFNSGETREHLRSAGERAQDIYYYRGYKNVP